MPRTFADDAVVLRTFNVGEADRFCMVLTKKYGRLAMRANGVRKVTSRRSGSLLPLHLIHLEWSEHRAGLSITDASCIQDFSASWRDPVALAMSEEAVEILLKLIEEQAPVPEAFDLLVDFLTADFSRLGVPLLPLFSVKLAQQLGGMPSLRTTDSTLMATLHPTALKYLRDNIDTPLTKAPACGEEFHQSLQRFATVLLQNQLGTSLVVPSVRERISSGVTPTCQVKGRAWYTDK